MPVQSTLFVHVVLLDEKRESSLRYGIALFIYEVQKSNDDTCLKLQYLSLRNDITQRDEEMESSLRPTADLMDNGSTMLSHGILMDMRNYLKEITLDIAAAEGASSNPTTRGLRGRELRKRPYFACFDGPSFRFLL